MYNFFQPKPLEYKPTYEERLEAAENVKRRKLTGRDVGSFDNQCEGELTEIIVRKLLGLQPKTLKDGLSFDFMLGEVKWDAKTRGGKMPFSLCYSHEDGNAREAKHNIYTRQLDNENSTAEAFLFANLRMCNKRKGENAFPGSKRQRNWMLYICGWASVERIKRDSVKLYPGSISERGNRIMVYKGENSEFFNHNLNGFSNLYNFPTEIKNITMDDVLEDAKKESPHPNSTKVDLQRIADEQHGKGHITKKEYQSVKKVLALENVSSLFHENQICEFYRWLNIEGIKKTSILKVG